MRAEKFQRDKVELERDLYTYADEADRKVLVISPNILSRAWVGKEISRGSALTIPILIDDMPSPDSPEWRDQISKTVKKGEYSHLNPQGYSNHLKRVLEENQFLEFRGWRDPSIFALRFLDLLSYLKQAPDGNAK